MPIKNVSTIAMSTTRYWNENFVGKNMSINIMSTKIISTIIMSAKKSVDKMTRKSITL